MFGDFTWWQGVVEDRIDPLKLGRCRVRVLGYHTDNKDEGVGIPTEHLPWATPMQPITSAAMNGIGTTPLGPVEGTWVFGFFRDGANAQEPVMIGTFGGVPIEGPDPSKGFNDPSGRYPLSTYLNEQDTNRLARGGGHLPLPLKSEDGKTSEDSPSLDHKRKSRTKDVPIARAGDMSKATIVNTTKNNGIYDEKPIWHEPNPRYGGVTESDTTYLSSIMENKHTSMYPHNHVRMSESGHVEEWDDSSGAERLHRFHKTGTFEEIQPDGTKVVKVVGSNYEIVLGNDNVVVNGTCNVTIGGDCRLRYKKDLVVEVEGDYHLNVHGEMRTKISGNQATEVFGDRKTVINVNDDLKVGNANQDCKQIINIDGSRKTSVTKDVSETIGTGALRPDGTPWGNLKELVYGTMGTVIAENTSIISVKDINISCLGNLGLSTNANYDITVIGNSTSFIGGNSSINVLGSFKNKIGGTTHKEYVGAFYERWDGDKHTHTGADTFSRFDPGVDHSCPADTRSPSATDCTAIQTTGL